MATLNLPKALVAPPKITTPIRIATPVAPRPVATPVRQIVTPVTVAPAPVVVRPVITPAVSAAVVSATPVVTPVTPTIPQPIGAPPMAATRITINPRLVQQAINRNAIAQPIKVDPRMVGRALTRPATPAVRSPLAGINLTGPLKSPMPVGSSGGSVPSASDLENYAQQNPIADSGSSDSGAYDAGDYYGSSGGGALPALQNDPQAVADAQAMVNTTAAVKKSWWRRLLEWLGLAKADPAPSATQASMLGEGEISPNAAAASLVRRARMGDQNAMGLIAMVRENATKGLVRARQTLDAMLDYIRQNPANAAMAGDAVTLSNRMPMTNNIVSKMAGTFGSEEERVAFIHGVKFGNDAVLHSSSAAIHNAHRAGRTVNQARKLQANRAPARPGKYSHVAAWQLGTMTG